MSSVPIANLAGAVNDVLDGLEALEPADVAMAIGLARAIISAGEALLAGKGLTEAESMQLADEGAKAALAARFGKT